MGYGFSDTFIIGRAAMASKWLKHLLAVGIYPTKICVLPAPYTQAITPDSTFLVTDRPLESLQQDLSLARKPLVILADFPHLIKDSQLNPSAVYLNLHNGDVSRYRGMAQICVLAAVARGDRDYGATLQRILPGEEIDGGGVVMRKTFTVASDLPFSQMMTASLENLSQCIRESATLIALGRLNDYRVPLGTLYDYSDVVSIMQSAKDDRARILASDLGPYRAVYPGLFRQIQDLAKIRSK